MSEFRHSIVMLHFVHHLSFHFTREISFISQNFLKLHLPHTIFPGSYRATSDALICSKSTLVFSDSMPNTTISSPLVSLAITLQIHMALKVFHSLPNPNIFPFNAIIRVLAEEGFASKAVVLFKQLKYRPLLPNDLTFSFLLKACCRDRVDVDYVKQLHSHVLRSGFMCDSFVRNGLLMVYARAVKDLSSARQVFEEMPDRNLVSCWTSLISGYARLRLAEEALKLFVIMLKEKFRPKNDTMISALSACSSLATIHIEKWVNLFFGYKKNGQVEKSREIFDDISYNGKRSVLSWNTMIRTYVQNGCDLESSTLFKSMMENYDCLPDHVTMVSVLSACAEIGDRSTSMGWFMNLLLDVPRTVK
ncbi:hypothetical protein OROGR_009784 [Orobanche gracilis]